MDMTTIVILLALDLLFLGLMGGVFSAERRERRASLQAVKDAEQRMHDLVEGIHKAHNDLVHQLATIDGKVENVGARLSVVAASAGRPGPTQSGKPKITFP